MAPPATPAPGSIGLKLLNVMTSANSLIYKLSGGRFAAAMGKAPILLLHHRGRRSGKERTTPVLYLRRGEDLVIVGSRAGSDATPAWWLNIKAAGRASVTIARDTQDVTVRRATADEERELWPELVAMYPDYDVYKGRTSRKLPVIVLEPA